MGAQGRGYVELDEKGQGGIEHQLDKQSGGKGEKILVMADAKQRWFDGGQAHRDEGANVVLTIDEKIQYVAERELQFFFSSRRRHTRFDCDWSSDVCSSD